MSFLTSWGRFGSKTDDNESLKYALPNAVIICF